MRGMGRVGIWEVSITELVLSTARVLRVKIRRRTERSTWRKFRDSPLGKLR